MIKFSCKYITLVLITILFMLVITTPAAADIYYVNPAYAEDDSHFQTIRHAVDNVTAGTPGTTIIVDYNSGIPYAPVEITTDNITLTGNRSETEKPVVRWDHDAAHCAISITSADNVTIEGFDALDSYNGISAKNSVNLTLRNNSVSMNKDYGIKLDGRCNNARITGNNVTKNSGGICIINDCDNATLINNTVCDNEFEISDGSDLITGDYTTVINMTVNTTTQTRVSFTCDKLLTICGVKDCPSEFPAGTEGIGRFVSVTGWSGDSWISLNMTYSTEDISGIDPSLLRIWNCNGADAGEWTEIPAPNGVDTDRKYVYANITDKSLVCGTPIIFGPLETLRSVTYYVDPGYSGEKPYFKSIPDALNAVRDGTPSATIIVAGSMGEPYGPVRITKDNVHLMGNPADERMPVVQSTVVHEDGITVTDANNVTIEGINVSGSQGSGIFAVRSQNLTLRGNRVTNNVNSGIRLASCDDAGITGNTVMGNMQGLFVRSSTAVLTDNVACRNLCTLFSNATLCDFITDGSMAACTVVNLTVEPVTHTNVSFNCTGMLILSGVEKRPAGAPHAKTGVGRFVSIIGNGPDDLNTRIFLEMNYASADLSGMNEESLAVWNCTAEERSAWEKVETGVNTGGKYVYADLTSNQLGTIGSDHIAHPFTFGIFGVTLPAPTSVHHSGSGGGSNSAGAGAAHNINAGGHASFRFEKSSISMVEITAGEESIPDVLITVEKKSGRPHGVDAPDTDVFEYDEVTLYRTTDDSLNYSVLDFTVSKSALESKGYAKNDVVMLRWHGGGWQTLETHLTGEDMNNYHYRAITPGFSCFAIAYANGMAVTEEAEESVTAMTTVPTSAPPTTPAATATGAPVQQKSGMPPFTAIITLVIVLLTAGGLCDRRNR